MGKTLLWTVTFQAVLLLKSALVTLTLVLRFVHAEIVPVTSESHSR